MIPYFTELNEVERSYLLDRLVLFAQEFQEYKRTLGGDHPWTLWTGLAWMTTKTYILANHAPHD